MKKLLLVAGADTGRHNDADRHNKGWRSEELVSRAIEEIAGDGSLLSVGLGPDVRITKVVHARPNDSLDRRHADFLVQVEVPWKHGKLKKLPVPIQVKASERHRREFEVRMARKGLPHIAFIAVKFGEALEAVKKELLQCLRTAILMWREGKHSVKRLFESYYHLLDQPDRERRQGESRYKGLSPGQLARRQRRDRDRREKRYYNLESTMRGHCGCHHCHAA